MVKYFSAVDCLSTAAFAFASELVGCKVNNGLVYVHQKAVPAACFAQLIVELNGDNLVVGVFLGRNSLRGSVDANISHAAIDTSVFS